MTIKEYGLACNYSGDAAVSPGAKCYVTWTNPGMGGDRKQVWVKSRGGRPVIKVVDSRRLSNFRAVWIPDHVREWTGIMGAPWWTKDKAEEFAKMHNDRC